MNADRSVFTILRVSLSVVVFALGLALAPAAVLAQTGWHPQTLPAPEPGTTYSLGDIKALSMTEVWLAGGVSAGETTEAAVFKTLDGSTWSLLFRKGSDPDPWKAFAPFVSLSVVDGDHAWAGGLWGMTAYTTDGGLHWLHDSSPCGSNPPNVAGTAAHGYVTKAISPSDVWFAGWDPWDQYGQIWHRPYSGDCAAWGYWPYRLEAQTGYSNMYGFDAADASNAWAVSSDTFHGGSWILHTTNGGESWAQTASPGGMYAFDVAAVSHDVAWAVGQGGSIAKTVDGGTTWVMQGSGVASTLWKIAAVNTDVAWAVGENGTIIKTTDGGATWRSQVSGTAATLKKVTVVDVNTAWAIGDQAALLAVTDGGVYQPLSAPGVSGMNPAGGPVAGGTGSVFVSGRDFRPGARVLFDGVPAAAVEFRSSGELMVTTPAHASGIVDVTVVNPDGQAATKEKAFAFAGAEPLIVSLSPSYGYVDTTVELDIFGGGLTPDESSYEPVPTVKINGTPVSGSYAAYHYVHVVFDRSLLTTAGMADIAVTTAAGTSNTLLFAVNHGYVEVQRSYPPAPAKTVTIPSLSGPIQATFYSLSSNGYVRIGKAFESPEWLGGSWSPGGYSFWRSYHYEVSSSSSMYYQAAMICFPYTDGDVASAGMNESRLRLLRYVDYNTAWEDVTVHLDTAANTICGTTAGLMTYFALAQGPASPPPPVITGIEPAIGPPAGGASVTISGSRFPADATVTFGGVAATNVSVVNGIRITAQIPPHALGVVDVEVGSPGQNGVLTGGFEYVGPPAVMSLAPNSGHYDTEIAITGTGFRNGCTITFGGQATGAASVTETAITVYAPSHAAGLVDVMVTNADGQSATLAKAFTYVPAPTIAYVEPNAGPVEGSTTVTIKGTGFQTGATVIFDGTEAATDVAVVNATTITAVTPGHAAGSVGVMVYNPDNQYGAISGTYGGFTYGKSPSIITWVNPASIVYGTKLSAGQLNATANVEGTFTYSPAVGNLPAMGSRTLTVYFTPTDTDTYTQAQKSVSLIVLPLPGDVNADGDVDVRDAIVVLQVLSGKPPSQAVYASAAADGDGAIGLGGCRLHPSDGGIDKVASRGHWDRLGTENRGAGRGTFPGMSVPPLS